MAKATVRVTKRRQRARSAGLCSRCCKGTPNLGRSICASCNASAALRVGRKRKRDRETAKSAPIIEGREHAGDVAREYHVYKLAAHHYEEAIELSYSDESALMRISEKLADVLWLGNQPASVNPVNDRLLAMYPSHPERTEEHIQTLFRVSRQLWADSRTYDKIPVLSKAIQIAELSDNPDLLQEANIQMASAMNHLARFEEADGYLRAVEQLHKTHNTAIHIDYERQKGNVAAGLGNEKEAFASFDRAIALPGDDTNPYRAVALWIDYGSMALTFGRTKLAKAHREHALLGARRSGISWLIPACCLWYAGVLMNMGEYSSAREYLEEALTSDAQTAVLDEMIVAIGIPLALEVKDEVTLQKCVRPHVIDLVFLSRQPARIAGMAWAFARLYAERGQQRKAQTLLHRAVEATDTAHDSWDLSLEIARSGARADFPKARRLLAARAALPCARVAQAYLYLFEAFVAHREKRVTDAYVKARDAVALFDQFEWRMYADMARSLLPLEERHGPVFGKHNAKPFSDTHAKFTEREREIAVLILKGLTNRAMADTLLISENTVEKHVAAVMHKLGIRSRYQLPDHLTESVMRSQ